MTASPRLPLALAAGLGAVVLTAACSSSSGSPSGTSDGATGRAATSTPKAAAPTGTRITAKLTEFHIALSRTSLTPGTYTFVVKNAGHITHALTVDGKHVDDKGTGDLGPGQSADLTVTLSAGKYDVFCPVGDHKMEGMDETVQVG